LLGAPEAAAYLEISLVWLYALVKRGDLHPAKKKGRLVFRFRELWRYKQNQDPDGPQAATGGLNLQN
jgi:hypothetical protein